MEELYSLLLKIFTSHVTIHESLHRSDSTFWEVRSLPFFEVTRDPTKTQATEPPRSGWKLPDEEFFLFFWVENLI